MLARIERRLNIRVRMTTKIMTRKCQLSGRLRIPPSLLPDVTRHPIVISDKI